MCHSQMVRKHWWEGLATQTGASLSVQVMEMWEGKDSLEALSKVSDSEKPL